MFVFLSKVVDVLLEPVVWTMLLIAAAWGLRRRPRLSTSLLLGGLAVLYVLSLRPVASGLMRITERSARNTFDPSAVYDAVILLGGGLDPQATGTVGQVEFNEGPERFLRTYELLRAGVARHVIISAGSLDPDPDATIEAEALAKQLEHWGISRERILVEGRSRNTRENAAFTAELLEGRGWKKLLLVTSAFHMDRADGCFRAVGIDLDALPVDVRGAGRRGLTTQDFLPRAHFLNMTSDAVRELFGRQVYRLMGYSAPAQ